MIEQKYIDVIESLGWNILGDLNDTGVELQQASPAGEDFVFYTDTADFPKGVIEYARDFDPDEHVELWVEHRGEGGCPSTVRELVDDAEAIKKMLKTLADALITAQSGGRSWLLGDDLVTEDNLFGRLLVLRCHPCRALQLQDHRQERHPHSGSGNPQPAARRHELPARPQHRQDCRRSTKGERVI